MGFVEKFDWPAGNQLICLGGGILWGAATLAYQRETRNEHASGDITVKRGDGADTKSSGRGAAGH